MTKLTLCFLIGSLISAPAFAKESWNGKIVRASDGAQIDQSQLFEELSRNNNVIMGERHYSTAVQQAEADIITGVTLLTGKQNNFTTAWEFLNASQQKMVQVLYAQFVAGQITAGDLLDATQGQSDENKAYAPVLEATKALGGALLATNLTRQEKSPVVKGGIKAADPKLVPPGFEMGSTGYHDRFVEFMGQAGHASPEMIENYYAAQCLTDDVIAYHVLNDSTHDLKFLVIGSFHTDYLDGTVARIKIRAPELKTGTVRIVDASDYEEADLPGIVRDAKYGEVADYVYYVNEPAPAQQGFKLQLKRFAEKLNQVF